MITLLQSVAEAKPNQREAEWLQKPEQTFEGVDPYSSSCITLSGFSAYGSGVPTYQFHCLFHSFIPS